MDELKRIIEESEIMQEDDNLWPPPDRVGRQVSVQVLMTIILFYITACYFCICS